MTFIFELDLDSVKISHIFRSIRG